MDIIVPPNAISVNIVPASPSIPTVGDEYSLICTVATEVDGLQQTPSAQWLHNNKQVVNGATISQSVNGVSIISFSPLNSSHSGSYICRGIISSPALPEPLIINRIQNITLKGKYCNTGYIGNKVIYTLRYNIKGSVTLTFKIF